MSEAQAIENLELSAEKIPKKKRCWEIDLIRGLCIIYTSIFHFCFIGRIYRSGFCIAILNNYFFTYILHYPVLYTLMFVSGISKSFTKNDYKRFVKIGTAALCITWITTLAAQVFVGMEGLIIVFGMLHQLSFCIIFFIALDWILSKLDRTEKKYFRDMFLILFAILVIVVGMLYFYPSYVHYNTKDVPLWASLFVTSNQGYNISPGDFFAVAPTLGFYIFGTLFGKYF